jgi:hypothetical protein
VLAFFFHNHTRTTFPQPGRFDERVYISHTQKKIIIFSRLWIYNSTTPFTHIHLSFQAFKARRSYLIGITYSWCADNFRKIYSWRVKQLSLKKLFKKTKKSSKLGFFILKAPFSVIECRFYFCTCCCCLQYSTISYMDGMVWRALIELISNHQFFQFSTLWDLIFTFLFFLFFSFFFFFSFRFDFLFASSRCFFSLLDDCSSDGSDLNSIYPCVAVCSVQYFWMMFFLTPKTKPSRRSSDLLVPDTCEPLFILRDFPRDRWPIWINTRRSAII